MKVFVGMSGGVDSSVTASLLVEQGYDVVGIYMKNWSEDLPGMKCPWAEDLADAKRVAVQLGIDFRVFDFEKEYREKVVQYMVDEYSAGRTPNPDIMCNQEVKFKLFLDTSLSQGADMIATGHYAKTRDGKLLMANDIEKDQTYFLYRAEKSALEKTLFPLGNLTKSEVREIAKKRKLFTASKKESMGVCFVGQVGMKDFLGRFIKTRPGDIVDKDTGQIIGLHEGAVYYTIGQRHGLNIGGGLPYYVTGKDMKSNIVYASKNINSADVWSRQAKVTDVHWISGEFPKVNSLKARVRHRAKLVDCSIEKTGLINFDNEQRAVTSGQSIVFYQNEECLGGGVVC